MARWRVASRKVEKFAYVGIVRAQDSIDISILSNDVENSLDKGFVLLPSLNIWISAVHLLPVERLHWPPDSFLAVKLRWVARLKDEFEASLRRKTRVSVYVGSVVVHDDVECASSVRIMQIVRQT